MRKNQHVHKHQIVSEYLTGNESYKSLGDKYGVQARTIQSWVRAFRKQSRSSSEPMIIEQDKHAKELQKQLEQVQLKNDLLEEMLRLSEEQTGIDFRKKFGTKQS